MMPPLLDLNLATRPFRNNTLLWVSYGVGLAALLGLTAWNLNTYSENARALEKLREDLGTYENRKADLERRQIQAQRGERRHDLETLRVQASKANAVIELKAFSWTELFNQLERILPNDVKMQSIKPVFRIGRRNREQIIDIGTTGIPVTVEGTSKSWEALLEFESVLLEDPHFAQVEPERSDALPSQEWLFLMRFQYFPDAVQDEVSEPEVASGPSGDGGIGDLPDDRVRAAAYVGVAEGGGD